MRRRSFLSLTASLALASLARPSSAQTPVAFARDSALANLLRLLPDGNIGNTGGSGTKYVDLAAQLAEFGIVATGTDIDPDAWFAAVNFPGGIPDWYGSPLESPWRDMLGFDMRGVDQMVASGPSDESIVLHAGRFDAGLLADEWRAQGYTETATNGVTWYTLGADNVKFDPQFPTSDYHDGALSHLALLDGGTVVGTAKRAAMEEVLARHEGGGSLPVDDDVAKVVAGAPDDLLACAIADGATIGTWDNDPLGGNPNVPVELQTAVAIQMEQRDRPAPMPPIALVMVGATVGTVGRVTREAFPEAASGHAVAVIVPENEGDAAIMAERITERLPTFPVFGLGCDYECMYPDIFTEMVVDLSADGAVLLDFTPAEGMPATSLMTQWWQQQLMLLYT